MKSYILFIALSVTFYSKGQKNDPNLRSGQMFNYNPILSSSINKFVVNEKSIKGSRFVFKEFYESGKIYIKGKTYTTTGINLDALNKNLVLKIAGDSILVLNNDKIDSVKIGNNMFRKFIDNSFFQILIEKNENLLLKEYGCRIVKGRTNIMMGKSETDEYKLTESYYLFINGRISKAFKLNKKNIINLLGETQKPIKPYLRENKLNLKKEEDLVKLMEYLYSE